MKHLGQDVSLGPPKFEAIVLPSRPRCSIVFYEMSHFLKTLRFMHPRQPFLPIFLVLVECFLNLFIIILFSNSFFFFL